MGIPLDSDWNYNIERQGWWNTSPTTITVKAANAEFVDNMSVSTPVSFNDLETVTINITPKQA